MEEHAEVIERLGLRWSSGAPMPVLVADENRCYFAFYGSDDDPVEEEVRVAEVRRFLAVRFGLPDTDVLHTLPLWGNGLRYGVAHEVHGSRWLAEVRRQAADDVRVEKPVPYPWARHFFLAFHDSSLELLAEDIVVREDRYISVSAAAAVLAAEIG